MTHKPKTTLFSMPCAVRLLTSLQPQNWVECPSFCYNIVAQKKAIEISTIITLGFSDVLETTEMCLCRRALFGVTRLGFTHIINLPTDYAYRIVYHSATYFSTQET
jgi:hypothetical protein